MVTLAARTGLLRLVKKCVEMGADPLHVSYYADQYVFLSHVSLRGNFEFIFLLKDTTLWSGCHHKGKTGDCSLPFGEKCFHQYRGASPFNH